MQLTSIIKPISNDLSRIKWLNTDQDWRGRATKAEEKLAAANLIIAEMKYKQDYIKLCAEDIIAFWPHFTLRSIWKMAKMVDTLKEAINE